MTSWIVKYVPAWLHHPHVLAWLAVTSVALFIASVVGVPTFLARLPVDYFTRKERSELGLLRPRRPWWHYVAKFGKNLTGAILLIVGLAMLVLPGQGLLSMVVGLMLLDFPGKRRLERRIIAIPWVFRGINALRSRAGRPPFERGSWV